MGLLNGEGVAGYLGGMAVFGCWKCVWGHRIVGVSVLNGRGVA